MLKKITRISLALGLVLAISNSYASNGAATFKKSCKMCHVSGMLGAPKIGDKAAWAPLIAKGHKTLLKATIQGKGRMMARGGCRACSDEDLSAAIDHMVERSR